MVTVNFGEFRVAPGSDASRFDTRSTGNTYQYDGTLRYFRHPEGPRFDPTWVLQAKPGGEFANKGALGGYAYVIPGATYATGPSAGIVLPATNASRSSIRFEGWRPEWTYLYGPHMMLNYAFKDIFGKERVFNPAGGVLDISGSFSQGFDQVGTQKFTYSGMLTLKMVRTE